MDVRQGVTQERILSIEPHGNIALVALELPFNNQDLIFQDVFLEEEGKPERTHMEKSFNKNTGKLNVGVVSGRESGFDGREIRIRIKYIFLDKEDPRQEPFDASRILILSALDAEFEDQRENQDRVTISWGPLKVAH